MTIKQVRSPTTISEDNWGPNLVSRNRVCTEEEVCGLGSAWPWRQIGNNDEEKKKKIEVEIILSNTPDFHIPIPSYVFESNSVSGVMLLKVESRKEGGASDKKGNENDRNSS